MNKNSICVSKKLLLGLIIGIVTLSSLYYFAKTLFINSSQSKAAEVGCIYPNFLECKDLGCSLCLRCPNGKYRCGYEPTPAALKCVTKKFELVGDTCIAIEGKVCRRGSIKYCCNAVAHRSNCAPSSK